MSATEKELDEIKILDRHKIDSKKKIYKVL